jgi:hypothetical protein
VSHSRAYYPPPISTAKAVHARGSRAQSVCALETGTRRSARRLSSGFPYDLSSATDRKAPLLFVGEELSAWPTRAAIVTFGEAEIVTDSHMKCILAECLPWVIRPFVAICRFVRVIRAKPRFLIS